jgi:hypothetical protein
MQITIDNLTSPNALLAEYDTRDGIIACRNVLLGLWAAARLGLTVPTRKPTPGACTSPTSISLKRRAANAAQRLTDLARRRDRRRGWGAALIAWRIVERRECYGIIAVKLKATPLKQRAGPGATLH